MNGEVLIAGAILFAAPATRNEPDLVSIVVLIMGLCFMLLGWLA